MLENKINIFNVTFFHLTSAIIKIADIRILRAPQVSG